MKYKSVKRIENGIVGMKYIYRKEVIYIYWSFLRRKEKEKDRSSKWRNNGGEFFKIDGRY